MNTETEHVEITEGSGNVFEDLGLDNAPVLKLKASVAASVNSILRNRGLDQREAARILGVSQPKISALTNGKIHEFPLEELLGFMIRLDRSVEISFRKIEASNRPQFSIKDGNRQKLCIQT